LLATAWHHHAGGDDLFDLLGGQGAALGGVGVGVGGRVQEGGAGQQLGDEGWSPRTPRSGTAGWLQFSQFQMEKLIRRMKRNTTNPQVRELEIPFQNWKKLEISRINWNFGS
jgi:hypothetical protein